ncbi:hypothetical protein [Anoxybacillus sp. P3H1B]
MGYLTPFQYEQMYGQIA